MTRVFLDASALFSAAYSLTGGARELIILGPSRGVTLILCEDIVEEAFRNIERKAPRAIGNLLSILRDSELYYVEPLQEHLEVAREVTAAKDAFVVASALSSRCIYLVSYDRAHLVGNPAIEGATGLKIITPGDMLAMIRESMREQVPAKSELNEAEINEPAASAPENSEKSQ